MTNTINNLKDAPGVIAKAAAQMMADKAQFSKSIDVADKSDFDGKNGYQAGDTIYISKPPRFIPGTSEDITSTLADIKEEKVALTLDTYKVIGMNLTTAEMAHTLSMKSWMNRILDPAVSSIALHVESAFIEKATDAVYNSVGSAGSNTFDPDTILAAGAKLNENGCTDLDNRFLMLNSQASRAAVNQRKALLQADDELRKQYKKGYIGTADGFDWLSSDLVNRHTNGNDVVFEVRTTVSVEGQSTLVVEALTTTTGTVKKGTVFTIAGVYAVHPITKVAYSHLQQFTVTADATADGSGYATLSVSPAFYTSASVGLQNIDAFPVDGAAITPVGAASTTYAQSLGFHKTAFRRVSVPLILPEGTHMAAQETVDGHTMRVLADFNILTGKMIMRLDYLGGLAAVRPEWACRLPA